MNVSVEFLAKNRQYRIIHMDDESYIIDVERSIWQVFFPILFWVMPQKMYKVDTETVERLKMPTDRSNNMGSILLLGIGGSAVLSQLLKPILDFTIETTLLVNILLLIVSVAVIIFFRLYMRYSLQNRLRKKVDMRTLDAVTIKIRPKYIKQLLFPMFGYLFCCFLIILAISLFLEISHFFGLVGFLFFFTTLLIINTAVIHPNLGKTNLYRANRVS